VGKLGNEMEMAGVVTHTGANIIKVSSGLIDQLVLLWCCVMADHAAGGCSQPLRLQPSTQHPPHSHPAPTKRSPLPPLSADCLAARQRADWAAGCPPYMRICLLSAG